MKTDKLKLTTETIDDIQVRKKYDETHKKSRNTRLGQWILESITEKPIAHNNLKNDEDKLC